MRTMTGADIIVDALERQGVRLVAGIPGGANLPLYDALGRSRRIRHILARHEQGAGFIAHGIARTTGQVGVCLATSGPGATNILTAIADAKLDSVPILCITGQVSTAMIGTDAFQEVDTYGLTVPITKHNFLVRDAAELPTIMARAFRLAISGRPGPVVIDVPKNVQLQSVPVDADWLPPLADPPPAFDPSGVARAAALINRAARPVLYVGGGAIASGACDQIVRLAELAGIPTTTTLMGLGAMPAGHPLSLGMLGMHGARYCNHALAEADLLIALGVRFDDRATGKAEAFCPNASIVHVDIDPGELDKIRTAHVGITGDLREVLDAMLPMIASRPRPDWRRRIGELKREHPLAMPGADDPRTPYGLIRAVARCLPPEAIVATDVGQHQMWVAQAFPFRRPRRWLTSGGLGTMGFGLPAAIGAALAEPDTPVVCFSGDGSVLMNIQELATAVEERANLKLIVMNNQSLGLVRQQQDLFYGERIFAADYRVACDFPAIARGFGMSAVNLDACPDPEAALRYALGSPEPCLIHATIDAREKVYPMVPPGAANLQMIGGETHAHAIA